MSRIIIRIMKQSQQIYLCEQKDQTAPGEVNEIKSQEGIISLWKLVQFFV